jgi:polar amino acid transport system substrate-binding protein
MAFGNQLAEIKKRGKIIIATSMKVAPQTYRDKKTGEPVGYDIEVGKLLAKDLEVEAEFMEVENSTVGLTGMLGGKYDTVISGMANKPSRALAVQFARGYVPYDQIMLVKEGMKDEPWQSLNKKGIKITAQLASTGEFRAKEAFPEAEVVSLGQIELMLEVASGRADACLIEAYLALPFAENHPSTRVLRDVSSGDPQVVAREWGCIPARQGEHAFKHYLDNWLNWYYDRGTIPALYDKIVGPALKGDTYWK